MKTTLIWATPDADRLIGHIARVSNPENQTNPDVAGLIRYCYRNQHWSPFEMVSACIEIETTRDIARQILRHRSFSFQEFSQRYQDVSKLPVSELRECRLQDTKNRQNSLETDDAELARQWGEAQREVDRLATQHYKWALANGIAKEQARVVLPEGLTTSRLYMAGTLRSWLHYVTLRRANGTQKEHQQIAEGMLDILRHAFPETLRAVGL